MARRESVRIAGVRLPTPRQAYGPREPRQTTVTTDDEDGQKGRGRRRRPLLEQARPYTVQDGLLFIVDQVQMPAPNGRAGRTLWICPRCGHRRATVYWVPPESPLDPPVQCRICAHLIYASQRELRRPEADPERVAVLLERYRTEKAAGHRRRAFQYLVKYQRAVMTRELRTNEWTAAIDLAWQTIADRLRSAAERADNNPDDDTADVAAAGDTQGSDTPTTT